MDRSCLPWLGWLLRGKLEQANPCKTAYYSGFPRIPDLRESIAMILHRNLCMLAMFALVPAAPLLAAAEQATTLDYSDFANVPKQAGTGYSIDSKVPIVGLNGQFTIEVYGESIAADGSDLLRVRVHEVPAVKALEDISTSSTFAKAIGTSATNTVESLGKVVTDPVDTLKAAPAGVGRFFKSIGNSVRNVATGSDGSSATDATKEALGINKARRGIARKVGIDPYTRNAIAAKRLGTLANAAFAGGVSLDVIVAVGTGGLSTAISVTRTVSDLAWSLPPEDIRARNEAALHALGVSDANTRALLGNTWYTPTLALALVERLKALKVGSGHDTFVALAATSESETEARFFIEQLRMAHDYSMDGHALAAIETPAQMAVFRTANGGVFAPAALDYVPWSEQVQAFADRHTASKGEHVLWLTGQLSPDARKGLKEHGWSIREHVVASGGS
ncbi:hypothetical protein [Dokdonella sp.]|uniref:hypothetical protein n=1 Tax=Dokdonella sp. TaxID=2291710 RepID=UPI003528AEBA